MKFDLMAGSMSWQQSAQLASQLDLAGFSGMCFTEAGQVPWMMITAAALAAPRLELSTGIAVALARSPMISAQIAWEFAANTSGNFRLGLGSQVQAHITRRYGAHYDKPALQMRDYLAAVRACIRAFRGDEKLAHEGPYYSLSYLPAQWSPPRHAYEDIKLDIAAVGPHMCRVAGELADGVHVHPMHSVHYLQKRLLPAVAEGAARAKRDTRSVDLIIPVFAIPGDSAEARAPLVRRARMQLAFYGSTPNYAFQFDDVGFPGTTAKLRDRMKAGDMAGLEGVISDEMLAQFTVIARWDDMAEALRSRYDGIASRLVMYLAAESIARDPQSLPRWGEVARAVVGE